VIIDRPWGRLATYVLNQMATVRLVTVRPGAETGAHYHRLRDEMWVVLDPGLTVEIGNRVVQAEPGQEFTVPAEEAHRVRCTGPEPGRILQVAFGYADEDDRLAVGPDDQDVEW
jgi:mannose-6-phosphate isomerase